MTDNSGRGWRVKEVPLPKKFRNLIYGKNYYINVYPVVSLVKEHNDCRLELEYCEDDIRYYYFYSSTDNGLNWRIDTQSNMLMQQYSFIDEKHGFGIKDNKLYKTDNGGQTWVNVEN